MDKCFLFTKFLDENGCFCLKISDDGSLVAPPAQRTFAEIRNLQAETNTVIVETSASASILEVELPWLAERKARTAIPYALEDKLAQSLEELHFAFDKTRYQNGNYLVAIIAKKRLQYLMHLLDEQGINFDIITLDWFALSSQDLLVTDSILLVSNDDYKGALADELAQTYIKKHPLNQVLLFSDSQMDAVDASTKSKEHSTVWIAQKLSQSKPLNLCQGEMQHGNTSDWIKKGYQLVGILACIWLVSLLLVNAISLYSLNKKTAQIDEQISVIYHEFFPEAKQVISPKFRIGQLLGNDAASQSRFWFLLNQFAKAMQGNKMTIEQLRFQNKTLFVTMISTDFAQLEAIERKLKSQQLKVKQTQASTHDQHVVATLELM